MLSVRLRESSPAVADGRPHVSMGQAKSSSLTGDTAGLKPGPRPGPFFFGTNDRGEQCVWVWYLLTICSQDMQQDIRDRSRQIENTFRDSLGVVDTKKKAVPAL